MAVDTYTNLQAAIANFLARDDLTAQIPDFITMAEARMSRELETRSQEKRVTASINLHRIATPAVDKSVTIRLDDPPQVAGMARFLDDRVRVEFSFLSGDLLRQFPHQAIKIYRLFLLMFCHQT